MVNRINEILKRYNLSAAKLAEQLEVPRSTISHILSERNKPSLEFIQKVINRYPEINVNWLLKGEGNFFKKERDLFSDINEEDEHDPKELTTKSLDENLPNDEERNAKETRGDNALKESIKQPSENRKTQVIDQENKEYANLSDMENPQKTAEKTEYQDFKPLQEPDKKMTKKIHKIVILYSDHSFDEYYPSR